MTVPEKKQSAGLRHDIEVIVYTHEDTGPGWQERAADVICKRFVKEMTDGIEACAVIADNKVSANVSNIPKLKARGVSIVRIKNEAYADMAVCLRNLKG